MLPMQTGMNTS